MHWLSGTGHVLWANDTELRILGYSREEYIGKPIMNFCPDEEEIVLEIFKQVRARLRPSGARGGRAPRWPRVRPLARARGSRSGASSGGAPARATRSPRTIRSAPAQMRPTARPPARPRAQLGSGNAIKDVPVRFRAKDGRIVPLLIDSNVNYTDAGDFNHTRCFIRDDTGRRVREAQVEMQLSEARRTAQLFDQFVSRTLHLIRTPCHLLLHNLEELGERSRERAAGGGEGGEGGTPTVGALLSSSTRLVTRIVEMTRDFTDSLRFDECATLVLHTAPHDVRQLARAAIDDAARLGLCRQGVALSAHVDAGGASVKTDSAVLGRVLRHLLRNAAHATSAGRVTLRVTHGPDGVTFAVVDTGKGLESDDVNIFQRYRQPAHAALAEADGATLDQHRASLAKDLSLDSGHEGIGIGLSLCYSLCNALGAELRYASRPGATRFWFELPRTRAEADASGAAPELVYNAPEVDTPLEAPTAGSSATWEPATLARAEPKAAAVAERGIFDARAPMRVLVVDDSPFCLKMVCTRLKRFGFTYDTAEDGSKAVEALRDPPPGGYALVLMDLRMPVMDGYEATRIARTELGATMPIVAVSAEEGVDISRFDGFEPKPLSTERLRAALCAHTGVDLPSSLPQAARNGATKTAPPAESSAHESPTAAA